MSQYPRDVFEYSTLPYLPLEDLYNIREQNNTFYNEYRRRIQRLLNEQLDQVVALAISTGDPELLNLVSGRINERSLWDLAYNSLIAGRPELFIQLERNSRSPLTINNPKIQNLLRKFDIREVIELMDRASEDNRGAPQLISLEVLRNMPPNRISTILYNITGRPKVFLQALRNLRSLNIPIPKANIEDVLESWLGTGNVIGSNELTNLILNPQLSRNLVELIQILHE